MKRKSRYVWLAKLDGTDATAVLDRLLRQYRPKGMDLSGLSQQHLTIIATRLNTRPRKCLDFRTPEEVYNQDANDLHTAIALQS